MKNIILFLAAAFTLSLVSSCSKDDDLTKTEILTGNDWIITGFTIFPAIDINDDGNLITDVYAILVDECYRDNTYSFAENGIVTVRENINICEEEPDSYTSEWSMNEAETEITIIEDGDPDNFIIESMTPSKMVLSFSENNGENTFNMIYTPK